MEDDQQTFGQRSQLVNNSPTFSDNLSAFVTQQLRDLSQSDFLSPCESQIISLPQGRHFRFDIDEDDRPPPLHEMMQRQKKMDIRFNGVLNDILNNNSSEDERPQRAKENDLPETFDDDEIKPPMNDLMMCEFDEGGEQNRQEIAAYSTIKDNQFDQDNNIYNRPETPRDDFQSFSATPTNFNNYGSNVMNFKQIDEQREWGGQQMMDRQTPSERMFILKQQKFNEDNYDEGVGKWDDQEPNKDNEVNEIDQCLGFQRESFQDQQFQSQSSIQIPDPVKNVVVPTEEVGIPIYQSPTKIQKVLDLTKSDTKAPTQPSASTAILAQTVKKREDSKKREVNFKSKLQPIAQVKNQEKKSIQKIKELFNSEEKFQRFDKLHSQETLSSLRKKKEFDEKNQQNQYPFKPKIDPISNNISTSQMDETQLSQRNVDPCVFLYNKGVQMRDQKVKELETQKKVQEKSKLQECTFKPKIQDRPTSVAPRQSNMKMLYERNKNWDEQRKTRLCQEQDKNKKEELKDCSFNPKIRPHSLAPRDPSIRGSRNTMERKNNLNNSISSVERIDPRRALVAQSNQLMSKSNSKQTMNTTIGTSASRQNLQKTSVPHARSNSVSQDRSIKSHIDRQNKAKEKKTTQDQAMTKNDGSKWSNEITKPAPPKITDILIQNLEKKLNHNNQKIIAPSDLKIVNKKPNPIVSRPQPSVINSSRRMNSRSSSRQKIEPVSKPDQDVAQDQQTSKPAEFKNAQNLTPRRGSPTNSNFDGQNTVKSSARVLQLKKEIEDLDARLLSTNTLNFEKLRTSSLRNDTGAVLRSHYESSDHSDRKGYQYTSNSQKIDMRGSVQIYQQIQDNASQIGLMQGVNELNISQMTGGEVSFDINKITQSRHQNLQSALENNLIEKRQLIQDLEVKLGYIQKESEAKSMKITHLKFERDNIINQIQIESLKKHELAKEAKEQVKQIDIKKKEDERAYFFAQNEINRQISDQQRLIAEIVNKIESIQMQLAQIKDKNTQESINNRGMPKEIGSKISQQEQKITNLSLKKIDIESNLRILKTFLKTITEEIQMTQEDLSGKLMQRAEFVAQREELDQMYDSGRLAFGKSFELYCKIQELNGTSSGQNSARFLSNEFETEKALSYFSNILQQIKQQSKSKYHQSIDQVQQKIENSSVTSLDVDKIATWVCQLSSSIGLQLDKSVILRRLDLSNKEKDELFHQRQVQLNDIILEIKRFEKLIKENTNIVDNMILPQLKAMSTTYNEHKIKYKKLKQACFVLRERLKKAEREMLSFTDEKNKLQSQYSLSTNQSRQMEIDLLHLQERLSSEQQEMDRLKENASQIDKEFRRAQQALLLKEREIIHKTGVDNVSASLNATQMSVFSNHRQQEQDDERLKKRFQEIEEKIRGAIQEKEDIELKLEDYKKILRETKESCHHAEEVVMNSHRTLHSNQQTTEIQKNKYRRQNLMTSNNQPSTNHFQDEGQYEAQITSFTDNDQNDYNSHQNNMGLQQKQNVNNNRGGQTTTIITNLGQFKRNKDNKENIVKSQTNNNVKETITRLDLSKVMAQKNLEQQQNSTYSGQRPYEQINYTKEQQIYGNLLDQTTFADTSNVSLGNKHQEKNDSQQNNSSVMNLSELIVNNSSALQNLLQMAKAKNGAQFKIRQSQSSMNSNQVEESMFSNQNGFRQMNNLRDSVQEHTKSQNQMILNSQMNIQNPNSSIHMNAYGNNDLSQSNIVDTSLMQYLDDLNNFNSNPGSIHLIQRTLPNQRRTSVETAEFMLGEPHKKQIQTIEVERSNRDQFRDHVNQAPNSPEMIGQRNRQYINKHMGKPSQNLAVPQLTQSVNFNTQSMSHSTQRSNLTQNQQRQSTSKGQGWMSKYLNSGTDFSRMYGSGLQESVSPHPNSRRGSKGKFKSQGWNRSSSQENQYGPQILGNPNFIGINLSKINTSSNSLGSINNFNTLHNHSYTPENLNYSRSGSRLKKKTRKLNKSMNGIDSSSMLQQSITSSSLLNPVTFSMNFGHNLQHAKSNHHQHSCNIHSLYGPECIQFSKVDVSFAERIIPLLDGAAFYKKFSSRQSLNENAFDPLNADKFPPESCGYGIRLFQLDKSLLCINVRMSLKIAVETTISLNEIVKPILPQTTMDIIRAQKQYLHQHHHGNQKKSSRNGHFCSQLNCHMGASSSTKDLLEEFLILESKGSISHLAKIGIVNKNSELYRQKCLDSTFYPFSIALTNGRVELIATSYETLKNWIIGINLLVSNKKHIPKLKQLMELKLD